MATCPRRSHKKRDYRGNQSAWVLSSAGDLADRLGVTPQTIRNYGKSGRIKAIRIASRAVRYALDTAIEYAGEAKSDCFCKT